MSVRLRQIPGLARSTWHAAERGFTLVEAVVALFVASLAIVVMVQSSARTLRSQAAAERHVEAVAVADAQLDAILLLPEDSLEAYADGRSGEVLLGRRGYVWRATVQQEGHTRLWRANVSVEWGEGDFAVETVFFRRGDDRLSRLRRP
jgi:Tfp pilus assembly protein PilV